MLLWDRIGSKPYSIFSREKRNEVDRSSYLDSYILLDDRISDEVSSHLQMTRLTYQSATYAISAYRPNVECTRQQ